MTVITREILLLYRDTIKNQKSSISVDKQNILFVNNNIEYTDYKWFILKVNKGNYINLLKNKTINLDSFATVIKKTLSSFYINYDNIKIIHIDFFKIRIYISKKKLIYLTNEIKNLKISFLENENEKLSKSDVLLMKANNENNNYILWIRHNNNNYDELLKNNISNNIVIKNMKYPFDSLEINDKIEEVCYEKIYNDNDLFSKINSKILEGDIILLKINRVDKNKNCINNCINNSYLDYFDVKVRCSTYSLKIILNTFYDYINMYRNKLLEDDNIINIINSENIYEVIIRIKKNNNKNIIDILYTIESKIRKLVKNDFNSTRKFGNIRVNYEDFINI